MRITARQFFLPLCALYFQVFAVTATVTSAGGNDVYIGKLKAK